MLLGIGISLFMAATLSFTISFLVLNMAKRGWLVLDDKEMNILLIPFINLLGGGNSGNPTDHENQIK